MRTRKTFSIKVSNAAKEVEATRTKVHGPDAYGERKKMDGGILGISRLLPAAMAATCLWIYATAAPAQSFPSKPIRLIVSYPPGGATDRISRWIGDRLVKQFGQPVVVDNRSGANGAIALDIVANAQPDGYTMVTVAQAFLTFQSIYDNFKYDVRKDLTPIFLAATFPLVLVVHPAVPVRSVKELIEFAKAHPNAVNYGSNGGIGSSGHILSEFFNQRTGLQIPHVPYKGAGPLYINLIGGHVQVAFAHSGSVIPHITSGRVRALSSTAKVRLPILPDMPTMIELGFEGFDTTELVGILGPARMPPAVVGKLYAEMAEALKARGLQEQLQSEGAQNIGATPNQFADLIKADVPKLANVLQKAGIQRGTY